MAIAVATGGTGIGSGGQNGADRTITLPTLSAGDLVLAWGGFTNATPTPGLSAPTDFTTIVDQVSGNHRAWFGYKIMGGTPDATLTCTGSGDVADGVSYNAFCFTGADTGTPMDNTPVVLAGSGINPDASAITVVTDQAWVVVMVSGSSIDTAGIAITNYTYVAGVAGNDNTDATASGYYRGPLGTGSENPGAATGWTMGDFVAVTVAIRPAGAAGAAPRHGLRLLGQRHHRLLY